MSIRYLLSDIGEQRMLQLDWCQSNVRTLRYSVTVTATTEYIDFLNDEDAIAFSIKFGVGKQPTLLEKMIAREIMLEKMKQWNLRHDIYRTKL